MINKILKEVKNKDFKVMIYDGKPTNYLINKLGVIKSISYKNTGKIKRMKQFDHKGYRVVNISIDGKAKRILVHRLVAENFIPNPENLPEVNHKNGKKTDNRVDNLEWTSHKDNMIHASNENLITYHYGEDNARSKITKKQAKSICKMLEENIFTIDEIAKLNDTTRGIVYSIKYGYTWKELSSKYAVSNHSVQPKRKSSKGKKMSKRLSEDIVIMICDDLQNTKLTINEIADKYETSKGKVEAIRYKNAWKDITKDYDFSNRDTYTARQKYGKE